MLQNPAFSLRKEEKRPLSRFAPATKFLNLGKRETTLSFSRTSPPPFFLSWMNIPFVVVHKNDWLNPSIPKIDPNLLICLPYPPKDSKSDLPLFSSICPFPKMVNNCKYGKYNHIQYIYIYILHIFIYGTIWDHISAYTHFSMISQQYAHLTKPPPGLRCSIPKANGRSASSSSKGRALRAGCPAVRSKPCRP